MTILNLGLTIYLKISYILAISYEQSISLTKVFRLV